MDSKKLNLFMILSTLVIMTGSYLNISNKAAYSFHKHREADTVNLILNFAQDSSGLFYPKTHDRGDSNGVIGTEFPLFYYAISFFVEPDAAYYRVLRLSSFLCYLIFIFGFYKLTEFWLRDLTPRLFASGLLAVNPIVLYYGLKIMPEIHFLMLSVWGAFFAKMTLNKPSWIYTLLSTLFFSIAIIIKPFAVAFLAPIAYATWPLLKSPKKLTHPALIGLTPLISMYFWFKHANKLRMENPEFSSFAVNFDFAKQLAAWQNPAFYNKLFLSYGIELFLSFGGLVILLFILYRKFRDKTVLLDHSLTFWFFSALAVLLVFGSNHILDYHDYYGLILIPPIALCLTTALFRLNCQPRTVAILFAVFLFFGYGRMHKRMNESTYNYEQTSKWSDTHIPKSQKIIIQDKFPPLKLNMLNRFGIAVKMEASNAYIFEKMQTKKYWFACPKDLSFCEKILKDYPNLESYFDDDRNMGLLKP